MTITDNHKIKTSELMDTLRKETNVYSYWNNEELDKLFPAPKETTTREFKDSTEPDMLNKSRDSMEGTPIMTLREYILATMAWKKKTGGYLDQIGVTILNNKLPDGKVASGYWFPDDSQVSFSWGHSGARGSRIGGRVAVSLSSSVDSAIEQVKKAGYQVSKIM